MVRQHPENVTFDTKGRYYLFELEDLHFVKDADLYALMPKTVEFCNNWNVPFDYVIQKLYEKGMLHSMFEFAYEISGYSANIGILIQEKNFHTTKDSWVNGKFTQSIKNYYDVYVVEDEYATLYLTRLIPDIIKTYYSWLYFEIETKRFSENLPDVNSEHRLDTYTRNSEFLKLTLQDLTDIVNNPDWRNETCKKFAYRYYNDMLTIDVAEYTVDEQTYKYSLIIPVEAIVNRDWTLVKDYKVHGVRDTRKGKFDWYYGSQNNSPYWRKEGVKTIRELFKK